MTSASQVPKATMGTCPPLPSESLPRHDENPKACLRLTREAQLLIWCARTALCDATAIQTRSRAQEGLNWAVLVDLAARHGVGVLLYRNLMTICPDAVPAGVAQQLKRYTQASTLRNRILTNELLVLLDAFHARGITVIPFKGPTLSLMAYGDETFRECGDLDFIVRQASIQTAREVLCQEGYRLKSVDMRDGDVCDEAFHYFTKHDGLFEVDLQWVMARRLFSFRLDCQRFWHHLEPTAVSQRNVMTLSPEDLLIVLCVHGSKHAWEQLKWICDINELVRAHPDIQWDQILASASDLRCRRMVLLGLSLAHQLYEVELPGQILAMIASDRDLPQLSAIMPKSLLERPEQGIDEQDGEALYLTLKDSRRERWWYALSLCRHGNVRVLSSPMAWCRRQRRLHVLYRIVYPLQRLAARCLPSSRVKRAIARWIEKPVSLRDVR